MGKYWKIAVGFFLLLGMCGTALAQVKVFAAASLVEVLEGAGEIFHAETGIEVKIIVAGSSTLARQIVNGAPADIFISANRDWVEFVQTERGFGPAQVLFSNQLVVITRKNSDIILNDLEALPNALGNSRLAIGDPEHVPAGIYAKQAMQNEGVWAEISEQLAPTSNVRGALNLVRAGAVPLGIVYATDVIGSNVAVVYSIDPALHETISYVAALAPQRQEDAQRFFTFLAGKDMGEIAISFGYIMNKGS